MPDPPDLPDPPYLPDRSPSRAERAASVLPGLALCVLVALLARATHQTLPAGAGSAIGEVILAVLFGLLLGNGIGLPAWLQPGFRFAFQTVLRVAIVLLGATFSVQQVAAIGGKALLMIALLMAAALATAYALGRLARVPARLATLIGVGTAVCGNSAIVAAAPVIGAEDDEVSFAVATNTIFGTIAVFLYPLIGRALHLDDPSFGTWAGSAVNDTSQVVATGFAFSEGAGRIATTVKLTRNALMGVVIVLLGLMYAGGQREGRSGGGRDGEGGRVPDRGDSTDRKGRSGGFQLRLRQSIPLFVVGFLVMAALNSAGILATLSERLGRDLVRDAQWWARVLILVALAGVGLSTRVATLRKTGLRPFYVGLVVAAVTSTLSLLWILTVGPAAS